MEEFNFKNTNVLENENICFHERRDDGKKLWLDHARKGKLHL